MQQGIINHFTWLLDASSSMGWLRTEVVRLADSQVRALADSSRHHQQETRVSVFSFSSPEFHDGLMAKCLVWDMDVLRAPSIGDLYSPHGNTALCDAVAEVIKDLQMIPQKHGNHSHVIQLLTDGMENASGRAAIAGLPAIISAMPGNWTIAGFVPDITAKLALISYGFPPGNIEVWDTTRKEGVREVATAAAAASDSYMRSRSAGMTSTTSLYSMAAPSAASLRKNLTPMTPGSYWFINVSADELAKVDNGRIDQFYELTTGNSYIPGRCYYEMTQRVRVQYYKKLALAIVDKTASTEDVYVGENARTMLGLPPESERREVRVSPGSWNGKGYKVYILSASMNRKLVPGSRLLVMR